MKFLTHTLSRYSWLRFAVIGTIATAVHYGAYRLGIAAGVPYGWSYAAGWVVSLAFNLLATARFTFRTRLTARKSVLFLACHAVNFGLHVGLLEFFVRVAGIGLKPAPLFVYAIAVPINYWLVQAAMKDRKP